MIHAWPKGRVIRTIVTVVAIGIAFDFGVATLGAWNVWLDNKDTMTLVKVIVYGLLVVAIGLGGVLGALIVPKSSQFLIEVEKEMVKVTWPQRPEVIRATIVIAIMSVILALVIFAVDAINKGVVYGWLLDTQGGGAS